jgi:hypothetical protein
VAVTGFGWASFPVGQPNTALGMVDENVQAAYLLESIFSSFRFGAKYYFAWELFDQTFNRYGLFKQVFGGTSWTQKQSAIAVHNMYQWLYDPNSSATSFSSGKLNYTVNNKPSTYGGFANTGYQDVVFQKSNGEFWIVMWNEQSMNTIGGSNATINVASVNVTLIFNEGAKSQINIYDPMASQRVDSRSGVSSMPIALPPYPIFVQVIV